MTKKICIMCEEKKEIDSFSWSSGHGGNFCEDCWRNNKNDYLYEYDSKFNYDLFYSKYPSERPADWEGVDIADSLKRLERELADNKEILPYYQNTIKDKEMVQDLKKEISRLEKEIRELKLEQQKQQASQIQISPK